MIGYLAGWSFFAALSWGSLALVLVGELVPGRWLTAFRTPLLALAQLGLIVPFAYIPIAVDYVNVYPFGHEPGNAWWTATAFEVRTAVVFLVQIGIVIAVDLRRGKPSPALGSIGLILLFVVVTSGSIDWMMKRTYHFESTVFPAIVFASGVASSIALSTLYAPRRTIAEAADLATMLFAFVMFWSYVSFSQLLIIWSGNMPRDVRYYVERMHGGWQVLAAALLIGAVGIPLFVLLFRAVKERPRAVIAVGLWVVLGQVADAAWWVGPSDSVGFYLLGFALAIVIGFIVAGVLLNLARLNGRPR